VADDARKRNPPPSGLGMLDGQAGTAGDDAGDRLARTRNRVGNLDQLERLVRPFKIMAFMADPGSISISSGL
jgi:hypothetical protein